jgi:hypothetical protein
MADELWDTLLKFHREVAAPEIIGTLREEIASANRETQAGFAEMHRRFDRLDALNREIAASLARIEQRGKRAK